MKKINKINKPRPDWSIEEKCSGIICGIDEVGRAPLSGPVVASCMHIPIEKRSDQIWDQVNDSKKISKKKREEIYSRLLEIAPHGIAQASMEEIDEINIYHASLLAMSRALEKMIETYKISPQIALIDGNASPKQITIETRTIVKGDAKSLSIAGASIIAKVWRDRLMAELAEEYPYYGWERNAGYPTKEHLAGIDEHGITPYHRKSFAPVRNFIEFGKTKKLNT